jgi:DNA-binding PadR family transcriptional regulator
VDLREHALTDASIEAAALYKTLRQLEENDCVTSEWDVTGHGPAKRVYCLTPHGEEHLTEWITVLDNLARSMTRFVHTAGKEILDESIKPAPTVLRRAGKGAVKTAEIDA